ncbi:MAG: hypothetical protein ABDH49_05330 [Candidatus Hydrothermales bacterium]
MRLKFLLFLGYITLVLILIFTKGLWNFITFPLLLFVLGFVLLHFILESEDLLTTLLLSFTFGYSFYVLFVSIFITKLSLKFKIANYTFLLLSAFIVLLSIIFSDFKRPLWKKIVIQRENVGIFLVISLLFCLFLYFLLEMNSIRDSYLHYSYVYSVINGGNIFTYPLFWNEPIFYQVYSDILLSCYSFFSSKEAWESAIIFAIIHFFPTIILLYKFYKKFTSHFGLPLLIFLVATFLASSRWIHSILHFIKIGDINGIIEIFKYGKYVYSGVTPKYSIFYFSFHSPTFVGLPSLLLIFFILFNRTVNDFYKGIIIGITLSFLSFCSFAFFPIITIPLFVTFLIKREYRKALFCSFLTALIFLIFNNYIFNLITLSSALPRIRFRPLAHTLVHSPSLVFFEYFFITAILFVGIYFFIKRKKILEIDIFLLILPLLGVLIIHLFSYGDTPFLMRYIQLISLFGPPFIYLVLRKIFELKNRKISILLFVFISLFIFFGFLLEIKFYTYAVKRDWKFSLTSCEKKAISFVREKFSKDREKIKIFERDSDPFMIYSGFFTEGSWVYNSYLKIITPYKDTILHKRFLDSLNIDEFRKNGFSLIVVTDDFIKKASQYTLSLIENKNLFEKIFECDDIRIYKLREN